MRTASTAGRFSLAAALVLALAGCAGTAGRSDVTTAGTTRSIGTDCFTVSLANDFRYLDDHNLIVYAPARRAYHVELSQACLGLRNRTRIGLRSRTDRMCGFAGDAVLVDGAFSERCSVLSVNALDEAEFDALIARFEGVDEPRGGGFEVEVVEAPEEEGEADEATRDSASGAADDGAAESRTRAPSGDDADAGSDIAGAPNRD